MDCKWLTVDLLIATLVAVGLSNGGVNGGPTCFNCDNLQNPHDCKTFTTCSDGQLCYKELNLIAEGHYTHSKGCTPKQVCDLLGRSSKRSGLQVCFQCCDHHFCNFDSCQKDFCMSNPCRNNATCINTELHFKCSCQPGYTGDQCATEIDNCASNPCQNFGTCQNFVNGYKCHCLPGFTGYNCETDVNECSSNPCMHGNCSDGINKFLCSCKPGYTGKICDVDINECSSSPCGNGRCEDRVNAFVCHCNRGFTGQHCEKETDECASSPCLNGGVCVDLVGEYGCGCKAGFRGDNCETNIDECTSNPCQNHGTCVDMINGYNCSCSRGFSGIHCEVDINECDSNPCHNGGKCVDKVIGYSCLCDMGFEGTTCERELGRRCYTCEDASHTSNCTNRTICKAEEKCYIQHELVSAGVFSFNLGCVPKTLCSMMEVLGRKRASHSVQLCYECCDKNDCNRYACASSQFAEDCFLHHCLHNGTCIARDGKPYCKCPDGFRGEHCEIDAPLLCYGCAYTTNPGSCHFLKRCPWDSACFIGRVHGGRVISMGCMEELYTRLKVADVIKQYRPDLNIWSFWIQACYDADKATHQGKLYTSFGTDFELATCCTDNQCNSHLV